MCSFPPVDVVVGFVYGSRPLHEVLLQVLPGGHVREWCHTGALTFTPLERGPRVQRNAAKEDYEHYSPPKRTTSATGIPPKRCECDWDPAGATGITRRMGSDEEDYERDSDPAEEDCERDGDPTERLRATEIPTERTRDRGSRCEKNFLGLS
ncbi:hypothetical protein D5F01_LYC25227 [Larimichthys crocea]|uniref:Uncharacterized protein n=1 Tax=Larimichthys crocea TaxID=215358 RepID=A0A6G0HCR3_LARCR|nr:hypothetical protein D5F01_LYC25227 [Larimichthys crocea]